MLAGHDCALLIEYGCLPVAGILSDLAMLTNLESNLLARAEVLGIKARTIVEGLRVGEHRSPYRGFSVEFVQHREYVPGDDIRHIDWKVYGRSERYTIKQYEQETNFIGHILLDASRSMLYGEGDSNKLAYAKLLAAVLGYLIVHQRDSASLAIFDDKWRTILPPSSQPGHVTAMLHALETTIPRDKTRIGPLLHEVADKIRRRGLVFLISDCFDDVPGLLHGLRHLRFQGHEVTVFHVLHHDELDFPFEGMVRFEGLEDLDRYLTRPPLIRPAYLRALETFLKELQQGCEADQCDYVLMDTSRPLGDALGEYLARRLRVKRL
ncbi:MAG: DUF58 domain-containing protein [Gemmatales bacterium]|nr:DUF58 domain-containing protein [Gemmatales bacterium]MDW8386637.1 DUF58 domain-containing protein [Gemmatales bacterium]